MSEKVHIHTTLSEHTKDLIDKYKDLTDKDGKDVFQKKKSVVIERAIELLDNYYNPKKNDKRTIWCRAREELNMVLVGKTTFLSYITGKIKKAYTNNIAIEVIEWYLGKRIEEVNLEEFLNGLKGMWEIANYFYKIELEKNKKGTFQMRFNHDLTRNYSHFWAGYFETLLTEYWNCSVESFIRNESFYLIIREQD
ncbi:MAG: hypothetical protein ACFFHV_05480 [Promethearchaeota archaeon]